MLPRTRVFSKYNVEKEEFICAQFIANRIVTLPLFGAMTDAQCKYMVDVIRLELDKNN